VLFDLQFSAEKNPIKPRKERQRTQKVNERERERDNSNVGRKEGLCLISATAQERSFLTIPMLRAKYLASK